MEKLDYEHILGLKIKKEKEVKTPLLQDHQKDEDYRAAEK